MIHQHAELYRKLTTEQTILLWRHLYTSEMVRELPGNSVPDGESLAHACRELSHAEVVMSLVRQTETVWCEIVDRLLEKPVYMCARGETSIPLEDYLGRPLPMPLGHRRGEAVGSGKMPHIVGNQVQKQRVRDPRIITWVREGNPKAFGTDAHRRFDLYSVGMTVFQFLAAGGRRGDINYDVARGYIRVDLPS